MKTSLRHQFFARLKPISVLQFAGLSLFAIASVLATAESGQAQTQSAAAKAAPTSAGAAAAQRATAKASALKSKGLTVQVSGHWVIEVRNPDGRVTAHREFENAIQPTGMTYLAALLAGGGTPGGLSIVLNGGTATWSSAAAGGSQPLTPSGFGAEAGPCLPVSYPNPSGTPTPVPGSTSGTACLITAAGVASGASYLGTLCSYSQGLAAQQPSPCSTNLMAAAPALGAGNNASGESTQISLSGSVAVTSTNPGSVTDVETVFGACGFGDNADPSVCSYGWSLTGPNGTLSGTAEVLNVFTMASLTGAGVVPYNPGQTISVSVTITFASPS